MSERQVSVYKFTDITKPVYTQPIDINPAILIPFYDPGSSTLFVTGKVILFFLNLNAMRSMSLV